MGEIEKNMRIKDTFHKVFWKKEKKYISYEDFAIQESLKRFEKKMKSLKQNTAMELLDVLWPKPIEQYEIFLNDNDYIHKWFESFYKYYYRELNKKEREIAYKLEEKSNIKNSFDRMLEEDYFPKALASFFEVKIKNNEYSLRENDFLAYLKKEFSFILDGMAVLDIQTNYQQQLKLYLKENNKNAYGLDLEVVDKQLSILLEEKKIGDGGFLYWWDNWKTNGIDKFVAVSKSPLYTKIKEGENQLYKYIFSAAWYSESYPIIKNMLQKSSTVAELWPWDVPKLYNILSDFYWWEDQLKASLGDKSIKLMDIVSDGFIGIKKQFNKLKEGLAEGIETDFHNKENSIYKANDVCYFMFGWTIWNFPVSEIETMLKLMQSNQFLKPSHAVITYFEAPDQEVLSKKEYKENISYIKATYGDPDEKNPYYNKTTNAAVEDFVLSWFESLWIPRDKIDFVVAYDQKKQDWTPARIKVWARANQDFDVITASWNIYKVKKDQEIRAIQSSRFTQADFKQIAEKSGFETIFSQSNQEKDKNRKDQLVKNVGLVTTVLRSNAGILPWNTKFKKPRGILYGTLIGLSLLGGIILTKNIIQNKKIKEKIEINSEKRLNNGAFINARKSQEWSSKQIEWAENIDTVLNDAVEDMYWILLSRYSGWSVMDPNSVKSLIKSQLRGKAINTNIDISDNQFIFDFIENFLQNNYDFLATQWFEIEPYLKFQTYEKDFIETINYNWPTKEWFNEDQSIYYEIQNRRYIWALEALTYIYGGFDLFEWYLLPRTGKKEKIKCSRQSYAMLKTQPDVIILEEGPFNKEWICFVDVFYFDRPRDAMAETYLKEWKKLIFIEDNRNNLAVDKSIFFDYFEITKPIVSKTINRFYDLFFWYNGFATKAERDQSYKTNEHLRIYNNNTCNLKYMIIKELIESWNIDNNIENVDYLLKSFYEKNKEKFEIFESQGFNKMPYSEYKKYQNIFNNTIKDNIKDTFDPVLMTYEWFFYTTSSWVIYETIIWEHEWKKYLSARESWNSERYELEKGKIVAQDFFDLQKKFNQ